MKKILVTGANKGIGLAIVEALLQRDDTFVYLGSRNLQRGAAARMDLVTDHPDWADRVWVVQLDVTHPASVSAAAASLDGLYGVVNNAGMAAYEMDRVLAVNVHGLRNVSEAFLPKLAEGGRIVQISSASGPNFVAELSAEDQAAFTDPAITREAFDALLATWAEKTQNAYGLSKALVNAYTLLLARENPDTPINACTPGFIETDLTRPFAHAQGKTPEDMGMKAPSAGTRSTLTLLFEELDGNGRYYGSDGLRSPMHRYRSPGSPAYTGD